MDERTDWERRARPSQPREPWEPPPRFDDWADGAAGEGAHAGAGEGAHARAGTGAHSREGAGARAGLGGGPRVPDISAVLAIVETLRRAVPHEVQEQLTALQRELLLTLRALIDWYLDRLDKPELEPKVEDIPIE
jgi:hypothetical protein